MKLRESQTLVWPRARKTLNTKTDKFFYSRYIPKLEKDPKLKIAEDKEKIFIYIVSNIPPHIRYIRGYMIPPS